MEEPEVMLRKPFPDGPVLMGSTIVQDDVDVLSDGSRRLDLLGELLAPVAPGMASDDHSIPFKMSDAANYV